MIAAAMFLVALSVAVTGLYAMHVYKAEQRANRDEHATNRRWIDAIEDVLSGIVVQLSNGVDEQKRANGLIRANVENNRMFVNGAANDLRVLTRMIDAKMDELTTRVETGPGNVMMKL